MPCKGEQGQQEVEVGVVFRETEPGLDEFSDTENIVINDDLFCEEEESDDDSQHVVISLDDEPSSEEEDTVDSEPASHASAQATPGGSQDYIHADNAEFISYISEGRTARVFKGLFENQIAAFKVFRPTANAASFHFECDILRRARHPHVVRFLHSQLGTENSIVLEFCSEGSLYDKLHPSWDAQSSRKSSRSVVGLSQDDVDSLEVMLQPHRNNIAIGIASAMNYLHSELNVTHCDLSSKNVLLDENMQPRVTDFGFSQRSCSFTVKTMCGLDHWMAPESLTRGTKTLTNKVDVYSYGIILWELWHPGRLPYEGRDIKWLRKMGKCPKVTTKMPIKICNIMRRCWNRDPNERPSFAEILESLPTKKRPFDLVS